MYWKINYKYFMFLINLKTLENLSWVYNFIGWRSIAVFLWLAHLFGFFSLLRWSVCCLGFFVKLLGLVFWALIHLINFKCQKKKSFRVVYNFVFCIFFFFWTPYIILYNLQKCGEFRVTRSPSLHFSLITPQKSLLLSILLREINRMR